MVVCRKINKTIRQLSSLRYIQLIFQFFTISITKTKTVTSATAFTIKTSLIPSSTTTTTAATTTTTIKRRMSSLLSHPNQHHPNNHHHHHVVVVGSVNYDMTVYTSKVPRMGETVLGTNFVPSCGGKGSNQAIACASTSMTTTATATSDDGGGSTTTTSMICCVGNDVFGQSLIDNLQRKNVRVLMKDNNNNNNSNSNSNTSTNNIVPSGVACITVDTSTGDNCIVVAPGANLLLQPGTVREQLLELMMRDGTDNDTILYPPTVLLVQLEIPYDTALEALRVVKEVDVEFTTTITNNNTKCRTILNPAPAPTTKESIMQLQQFYPYVDIIIPNESELKTLYDGITPSVTNIDSSSSGGGGGELEEIRMAKALFNQGIRQAVIVTLGSRGAMIVSRRRNSKKEHDNDDNIKNKKDSSGDVNVQYCSADSLNLACTMEPVVDTIGAGDGFCGSLASYLQTTTYDGADDDDLLARAVTLACGFASMSVRRRGATYPTYKELPECLQIIRTNKSLDDNNTSIKPSLTFVTGNKNKLLEVQRILSSSRDDGNGNNNNKENEFPYELINQKIDLPELQGNDTSEIAIEKCKLAAAVVNGPCFTEDTSLCFNALNGMPGPYIKWFLEKCGHDGLNQMLMGYNDKSAYALTVIAYTEGPDRPIHIFEGRTDGVIVPPRGSLEFGWDPIFQPNEGGGMTYAEMSKDDKNAISHRGRAFAKLRHFLFGK